MLWSSGLIMKREGDETGWVMEEGYKHSGRERERGVKEGDRDD